MLYLYRRVIFGQITKKGLAAIQDMNMREKAVFAPLLVMTIWMGIYPMPFIDIMSASATNLIENYEAAIAASEGQGIDLASLLPGLK